MPFLFGGDDIMKTYCSVYLKLQIAIVFWAAHDNIVIFKQKEKMFMKEHYI